MATIIRFPDVWKNAANRATVAHIKPAQVIALSSSIGPKTDRTMTAQAGETDAPGCVNPI